MALSSKDRRVYSGNSSKRSLECLIVECYCQKKKKKKCPSTVYIGETGRRLADRFREHRRDVINGRNDLPVPAHFNSTNHTLDDMKVAVLKAGLANQAYRKKQEMRLIFKCETMSPSGLNQDFSFT